MKWGKAAWAGLLVAGLLGSSEALAFDLNGAWATDRAVCGKIYERKSNGLDFSEFSELYGSGFIVSGNTIKAKSAKCTIKSQSPEGDRTVINASCATSIMSSELRFNYKAVDDDTLIRDFPEIPGMTLRYFRCPAT